MKKLILTIIIILISSFMMLNSSKIYVQTYHFPIYPSYYTGYSVPFGRIWDDQFLKPWSFQWPRSYQSAFQPPPLAYNPSYGLSSSYYPLISSYRPYSYNISAFLPTPRISDIFSFTSYPSYYGYSSPYTRYPYTGALIPNPYSSSIEGSEGSIVVDTYEYITQPLLAPPKLLWYDSGYLFWEPPDPEDGPIPDGYKVSYAISGEYIDKYTVLHDPNPNTGSQCIDISDLIDPSSEMSIKVSSFVYSSQSTKLTSDSGATGWFIFGEWSNEKPRKRTIIFYKHEVVDLDMSFDSVNKVTYRIAIGQAGNSKIDQEGRLTFDKSALGDYSVIIVAEEIDDLGRKRAYCTMVELSILPSNSAVLETGRNIVSFEDPAGDYTSYELLTLIKDWVEEGIDICMEWFGAKTSLNKACWNGNGLTGPNITLESPMFYYLSIDGQPGQTYYIEFDFDLLPLEVLQLHEGLNSLRLDNFIDEYPDSYCFLTGLNKIPGDVQCLSINYYNEYSDIWETTFWFNGHPAGKNFKLKEGEVYWINMIGDYP